VSDPLAQDSSALTWAAQCGHADCVRLLLPVSEQAAQDCFALRKALIQGHGACVDLLLPSVDSWERAVAVAGKLREEKFDDEASRVEAFGEANALEAMAGESPARSRKKQGL
jgi:hypothetical protein